MRSQLGTPAVVSKLWKAIRSPLMLASNWWPGRTSRRSTPPPAGCQERSLSPAAGASQATPAAGGMQDDAAAPPAAAVVAHQRAVGVGPARLPLGRRDLGSRPAGRAARRRPDGAVDLVGGALRPGDDRAVRGDGGLQVEQGVVGEPRSGGGTDVIGDDLR